VFLLLITRLLFNLLSVRVVTMIISFPTTLTAAAS